MKIFITSFIFIFSISVNGQAFINSSELEDISNTIDLKTLKTKYASSSTCFLKGERVSGMNKICTYSCVSGDKSITIKSTQLCPLSISG